MQQSETYRSSVARLVGWHLVNPPGNAVPRSFVDVVSAGFGDVCHDADIECLLEAVGEDKRHRERDDHHKKPITDCLGNRP